MRLLRIIPDGTGFGFMRFRRWSFPFSALLSLVTVALFLGVGLNFGIDFRGGTLIELQARDGRADVAMLRATTDGFGLGEAEVQEFGSAGDVSIRLPSQAGGEAAQQAAVAKVRAAFEAAYDVRRVETVGPRVSEELVQNGTLGVLLAILAVLVYLWFRFEWEFAIGAVIATLHDLVLTIGFFAATGIEFNNTSVAAILTIVGYSLNDTVVVFDRIRELLRRYKRMPIEELLDLSINSVLARTFMVSFTAFLALLALVFFGGKAIEGFSLAMLFGVVVGTYSSIFIAAPVLIYLRVRARDEAATEAPRPAAARG